MKRFFATLMAVCFLVPVVTGCTPQWVMVQDPTYYPGSIWESEDGVVRFTIDLWGDDYIYGTVIKEGEPVEMIFVSAPWWFGMCGCPVEDYDKVEPDEYGYKYPTMPDVYLLDSYESYDYIECHAKENYVVAEVSDSAIYEKGTQITLRRIDETKDICVKYFELSEYEKEIEKFSSEQTLETAEDLETAVSQARDAFEKEFGDASYQLEVFCTRNSDDGAYWLIKGKHWLEPIVSVPHIIFSRDGSVLAMWKG